MISVGSEVTIYSIFCFLQAHSSGVRTGFSKFQDHILLQSSADFNQAKFRFLVSLCLCRHGRLQELVSGDVPAPRGGHTATLALVSVGRADGR